MLTSIFYFILEFGAIALQTFDQIISYGYIRCSAEVGNIEFNHWNRTNEIYLAQYIEAYFHFGSGFSNSFKKFIPRCISFILRKILKFIGQN